MLGEVREKFSSDFTVPSIAQRRKTGFSINIKYTSALKNNAGGLHHPSVWWGNKPNHFRAVIFATKAECWLDYRGKVQPSDGWVMHSSPECFQFHTLLRSPFEGVWCCAGSRALFRTLHSTDVLCLRPLPEIRPLVKILLRESDLHPHQIKRNYTSIPLVLPSN